MASLLCPMYGPINGRLIPRNRRRLAQWLMLGVVSLTVMRDAAYVMGAVQDDARIVQGIKPQPSQGGDDVWVAMLDNATGDVSWINLMQRQPLQMIFLVP
jgi:hypothetical protein